MEIVEIPAKIFLIGEYLVLEGGDAVLEAIRPGYRFEFGEEVRGPVPHTESPAGRLLQGAGAHDARFRLLEGSAPPGYGGSTAECLMAWRQVKGAWPAPTEIHQWYRREVPRASGADLSLQAERIFHPQAVEAPRGYHRLYLLERLQVSKRPTHEDLAMDRPPIRREVLSSLVARFRSQILDPVENGFCVLGEFAEELSRTGRETEDSRRIRKVLEAEAGVEGVKGCGAGLHDQFLLAIRPGVDPGSIESAVTQAGLRIRSSLMECLW